jgi:LPXTG-site transpeptidase (sortase) family protein
MALYYYKKAPVKIKQEKKKTQRKQREHRPSPFPTVAQALDTVADPIIMKLSKIRPISMIFPMIFIISGVSILYSQVKPFAIHFLRTNFADTLDQEITPLVPESYEEIRANYISTLNSQYFSELLASTEDNTSSLDFEGTFYLTIEDIKIFDAPVTANVDSTSEATYQDALGHGLAHFKGTKLPSEPGNVLIYGHSAAGDYAEKNPQDVVTSFTRLFKLNIGDKIKININDEEISYIVKKVKEVNPEDVEILYSTKRQKTLTLMTCSPPGLSSNRLIVVAVQE